MELFNPKSNIDFMGARKITWLFSALVIVLSLGALVTKGINWGLDFTGGTQIEIAYENPADLQSIRERLPHAQVISYGTAREVLISIPPKPNVDQTDLVKSVMAALPGATHNRVEFIGPQVGQELAIKGALAIIISLLATMVYIAMRFEYRFAVSAAVALIHDPLLILGVFAFFQIPFDLKALAALLAIIGYSLNDTIVVFDRVRENFHKMRRANVIEIMNASINQTLSRTIMTSALTLVVAVALFVYGGEAIYGFSLALIIGIVVGTYSSIYIAGTLAIALGLQRTDLIKPVQVVDEQP